MRKKQTIVILVPILAHYRRDVYRYLSNSKDFDFIFFGGKNYENIKTIDDLKSQTFNYFSFQLAKHTFYFFKLAIREIIKAKPKAIVSSGVDFHLIHSFLLFFIFRIILRKKFYWWSQGTTGHQGKVGWIFRKMVYKLSSGVMLYSQAGFENLMKMKVPSRKLAVLNNCLNAEDYGFLNYDIVNRREKWDSLKILFIGRITSKVDLNVLLKSLSFINSSVKRKILSNIVGGGDIAHYVKLAKDYKLEDQVNFTGPLYGKDAHNYFLESDLFVYPGGIGLSIAHALSFGLPVITTDNMKLHNPEIELLKPGFNGDLYHDNDYQDLSKIILKWDQELTQNRNKHAKSCIDTVEKLNYLPEKVSENIISFLKTELLSK